MFGEENSLSKYLVISILLHAVLIGIYPRWKTQPPGSMTTGSPLLYVVPYVAPSSPSVETSVQEREESTPVQTVTVPEEPETEVKSEVVEPERPVEPEKPVTLHHQSLSPNRNLFHLCRRKNRWWKSRAGGRRQKNLKSRRSLRYNRYPHLPANMFCHSARTRTRTGA